MKAFPYIKGHGPEICLYLPCRIFIICKFLHTTTTINESGHGKRPCLFCQLIFLHKILVTQTRMKKKNTQKLSLLTKIQRIYNGHVCNCVTSLNFTVNFKLSEICHYFLYFENKHSHKQLEASSFRRYNSFGGAMLPTQAMV